MTYGKARVTGGPGKEMFCFWLEKKSRGGDEVKTINSNGIIGFLIASLDIKTDTQTDTQRPPPKERKKSFCPPELSSSLTPELHSPRPPKQKTLGVLGQVKAKASMELPLQKQWTPSFLNHNPEKMSWGHQRGTSARWGLQPTPQGWATPPKPSLDTPGGAPTLPPPPSRVWPGNGGGGPS